MRKQELKILEVTAFSAGICGVWTRVLAESLLLSRKHEVHVFSSDIHRGEEKKAAPSETIDNVKIKRFPARFSFGQNTFFWNFEKSALDLKPDIIVAHAYRQYYSTLALKVARKLKVPCFLVTHAPFLDRKLRSWKLNFAVYLYDNLIGKRIINRYAKVIAITKWEVPYLFNLGLKKRDIVYIPNGIPEEFFKIRAQNKKTKNILFFGRIAPIKDLETLIKAISVLGNNKITVDIIGPAEKDYLEKLKILIRSLGLEKQIEFRPAVYNLRRKIEIFDNHDIFILPSKREGMPQALIEAMSRGMTVISSKTDGGKEIIDNNKNGFLFEIGNEKELAEKINFALKNKHDKIRENARNSVKKFAWSRLAKVLEDTYSA